MGRSRTAVLVFSKTLLTSPWLLGEFPSWSTTSSASLILKLLINCSHFCLSCKQNTSDRYWLKTPGGISGQCDRNDANAVFPHATMMRACRGVENLLNIFLQERTWDYFLVPPINGIPWLLFSAHKIPPIILLLAMKQCMLFKTEHHAISLHLSPPTMNQRGPKTVALM